MLVVSTVLFSFVILGINFDNFLKENDFDATKKRMIHAFSRVTSHVEAIRSSLTAGIAFNQTDESLLASIELINNYQDKENYNAVLLDEEKKNVAEKLLDKVKFSFNRDIALYDKNSELIAFIVKHDGEYLLNFISYDNGKRFVWQKLESQPRYIITEYNSSESNFIHYHHPAYYAINDATNDTLVTYHSNSNGLYIKSHHNITDPKSRQIIAHIEMTNLLDSAYFAHLSIDLNVDIHREENCSMDATDLLRSDIEDLHVTQNDLSYMACGYIDTLDGKLFITAKLQKELLQQNLRENRYQLLLLIIGVTVVILTLLHYLFKRSLATPLSQLMEQIQKVRNRDYEHLSLVKSGDELETISNNIDLLASTVRSREASLKESRENLRYLSDHDVLTGLPNRRFFEQKVQEAHLFANEHNSRFALLFIDVDHFKEVNDTLGHPVGDILLRKIAETLNLFTTTGDTLARIGGDEFIILVEKYDHDKLTEMLGNMIKRFNQPLECHEYKLISTISVGIAVYPMDADDNISLIQYADLALSRQKDKGGNGYNFFSYEMAIGYKERVSILRQLKEAVKDYAGFYLVYQPKISVTTKKIVAVEALIRWNSPLNGPVRPDQFITFAEESGLIVPLGKWILLQACSDFVKLKKDYPILQYIGINISIVQLLQDNILTTLDETINTTGISPEHIEIEITESYIATSDQRVLGLLDKFREKKTKLSIDDFGTGYSSLNYLHKLPVTALKIDKTFIDNVPHSQESILIIQSIISLSKAFNLSVTAEGVEEIEQVKFLESIGCDEIQGYYYSRPLTYEQLVEYIKEHS